MMIHSTYETYANMKDSGVEWLGEIPANWEAKRFKFVAKVAKGKLPKRIMSDAPVGTPPYMSMDYLRGGEANQWVLDSNIEVVESNETLLLWDGSNSGEFIKSRHGVISSTVALVNYFYISTEFGWYFSTMIERQLRVGTIGMGIPHVDGEKLVNSVVAIPPLPEQKAIADFLDRKTGQIDAAVAIKKKQIKLLKERKQILIQNAITQGLNPDAPKRDSGVDWIGEIPARWEVKRLKYILDERNERSKTGVETLFMVSQVHGLVVRLEFHAKAEVAQSSVDNKLVYENDLVFNKLKAHLGVFFKSTIKQAGLVSPDYAVYKSRGLIQDLKYLEWLFRHPAYIGQFIIRATGVAEGLIRLYTDDLFDVFIPVPPKDEQVSILQFIKDEAVKFDQAIALNQQQIEKLNEYKTTVINSTVTGKIKVVDSTIGGGRHDGG